MESGLELQHARGQVEVADGERWRPPEQGLFKLNIAWSTSSTANQVGVGVLVRDYSGSVIAVLEKKVLACGDPIQMHAMAVLEALHFAFDLGLRSLPFEMGSKELLCLLRAHRPCSNQSKYI